MDQTRGWFYSLINLGVGLFDKAPYKHVICNGLINATDGKKLSKSLGNYTDPLLLVKKYGADAFRYYLMSSPVVKGESVNFDDNELEDVYKKCILRLDNVTQLFLMNKEGSILPKSTSTHVLDRWMVSRVTELINESTRGYDSYKLDEATRGIADIIDDISVWYTRRSRDRLKGVMGEDDKAKASETMQYTLLSLARVMAPVMPFISERVYQALGGPKESVHLEAWPEGGDVDYQVIKDMKEVRDAVSLGLMKRTEAKLTVKQPLSSVTFKKKIAQEYIDLICDELNVKNVFIDDSQEGDVTLDTTITEALQKEGDIRKLIRAVQDLRKERGLQPHNEIVLTLSTQEDLGDMSLVRSTCKVREIKMVSGHEGVTVDLTHGVAIISIE
jgi:isoleucyl-tRNA synthetase